MITWILIFANIFIFIIEIIFGDKLIELFALWPIESENFGVWQLVTYSFLHGSLLHIFFNMFALWMFGSELEKLFGSKKFSIIYFAAVLGAAITQIILASATNETQPTLGASGGVFGILLTFGIYFPKRIVILIFPPIPMPAWLFVILYGTVELFMGITGMEANVAHFAHLGGMLGAGIMLFLLRR